MHGVEHPLRDLQRCRPVEFVSHATKNNGSAATHCISNRNRLPIPGMPAVTHFSGVGFMGALYPSCTTPSALIPHWVIGRPPRQRGRPKLPSGMEKWKAKNV